MENQSHARSWQINLVIALLIMLLGLGAWDILRNSKANAEQQQQQQITKWEYKVGTVSDAQYPETINKLGAEGWEIVSVSRGNVGGDKMVVGYEILFRRPANAPAKRY